MQIYISTIRTNIITCTCNFIMNFMITHIMRFIWVIIIVLFYTCWEQALKFTIFLFLWPYRWQLYLSMLTSTFSQMLHTYIFIYIFSKNTTFVSTKLGHVFLFSSSWQLRSFCCACVKHIQWQFQFSLHYMFKIKHFELQFLFSLHLMFKFKHFFKLHTILLKITHLPKNQQKITMIFIVLLNK